MHSARTHLPPASLSHGRTFFARSIPADASNTAADVKTQRAHTHPRTQHDQHRLNDSVLDPNVRAPRRRYKHDREPRRSRRRGRSRHCRNAANATLQPPSAITPAPPSCPVPPMSARRAQPRSAQTASPPTQLHHPTSSTHKSTSPAALSLHLPHRALRSPNALEKRPCECCDGAIAVAVRGRRSGSASAHTHHARPTP
eukprot:4729188-Pleurochrysis_carterae.AAC.2